MSDAPSAFYEAWLLLWHLDRSLVEIIILSLSVSLTATAISAVLACPLGAALAIYRFPGRRVLSIVISAFMGLPPVVVGLIVYLLLSRQGPLGVLGLLFTPTAMIIAQCLLITPIIASLTRETIDGLWDEYREQLQSLGAGSGAALWTLLTDGRYQLLTAILAGFGRATAEVGAVMIVGGNIDHVTRVMTTAIALEVSKGDLALALGLGIVLILLSLTIHGALYSINEWARRRHG